MSKGIGGWGEIIAQDEHTVLYRYGTYNLNNEQYRNKEHLMDGLITIEKHSMVEPEIHTKTRRYPNGKKKTISKRIVVDVPYGELYHKGKIQIENSSNCWRTISDDNDFIAWHLVWNIFRKYQENGCLPERVSYNV